MASKTNITVGSRNYFRIRRTVGKKLKDGKWVPDVKAFYGTGKLDAERKYQEYMESRKAGVDADTFFGPAADRYMEEVFPNNPRYKDGTKLRYTQIYNTHIRTSELAGRKLSEIKTVDVQHYLNTLSALGLTHSALSNVLKPLKLIFRYFESEELCRDVSKSVYIPVKESIDTADKTPVWSNEELSRVFSEALNNHRLKLLLILAYRTGARIGELLALTYDDIADGVMVINKQYAVGYDDGKPTYTIQPPKTQNAYREIPLSEDVMEAFREHEQWHRDEMMDRGYNTEYVFTTSTGEMYDRSNLRRALQRYYKKVGVEYKKFHSYRKTFCSELCAAGAPLQVVYKIMGHSSIQVTAQYYVDVDLEQKREALSLMK